MLHDLLAAFVSFCPSHPSVGVYIQVTASLALSIMTLLGSCWTILHLIPSVIYTSSYKHYEILEDNITETEDTWSSSYEVSHI